MSHLTPEKRVQNEIIKFLKAHDYQHDGNIYWCRRDAMGPGYVKGSCDLWCVINGIHIEIEVKGPGGTRSPDQERWERVCKIIGAPYIVTDSVDKFIQFISIYLHK